MDEEKRFGFAAITRYRFYAYILSPLLLISVVFAGGYRWLAVGAVLLAAGWIGFVDPVRPDGRPTVLGISRDKMAKYVRSVLGRDLGE